MTDNTMIERAIVLNAFSALYPRLVRMANMPKLLDEIEELGEQGLDRFGMLTALLEKRGLALETRRTWRYMATMQRRHAEARARVEELVPRTDENAIRFDDARAVELTLHNAIMAAFEDAEMDLVTVLRMAGMDMEEGEALLSLDPTKRLRYEKDDEHATGYERLIGLDLATNISSHYPGGSLGVTLSPAGEIVWRLVMGQRKIGR